MAMKLNWTKCGKDSHWCDLKNLDLTTVSGEGVYIIWHIGNPSRVVRVGQGDIAKRLSEHRNNQQITRYGQLRVTWAKVDARSRDGVERYLADTWKPLVGDAFPDVRAIEVNSPF